MRIDSDIEKLRNRIIIIPGMPRSGTTSLYYYLGKHPEMFVPYFKEVNYFSLDYRLGADWYLGLYREMLPGQIGFDISPSYFLTPAALDRIRKFNDKGKLILAIRDPVEAAVSLYHQFASLSWRMPPFEEFIQDYVGKLGPIRVRRSFQHNPVPKVLDEYRKAFRDNLLFYHFALFKKNPLCILQAIESFVEVTPYFTVENFENIAFNPTIPKARKLFYYLQLQLGRRGRLGRIRNPFLRRALRFFGNTSDKLINLNDRRLTKKRHINDKEYFRVAEKVLADQRAAITETFARAEIQLGSGLPFS